VAAATDGDEQVMRPSEVDRGDHVGDTRAAHDQAGTVIDQAIPDLPRGIIARVTRPQQRTSHLHAEGVKSSGVKIARQCHCHFRIPSYSRGRSVRDCMVAY
jgi:hypothetical protein